LLKKKRQDKSRSSKTRNSNPRLLWLRRRDNKKRYSPSKELRSSRSSKRRKLPRNSLPRRWSKSSLPLKLFKRPRLLLPKAAAKANLARLKRKHELQRRKAEAQL